MKIQAKGFFPGTTKEDFDSYSGQMRRRRYDDAVEIFAESTDKMLKHSFTTILGRNDDYYYEFQYIEDFPLIFRAQGLGIEKYVLYYVYIVLVDNVHFTRSVKEMMKCLL